MLPTFYGPIYKMDSTGKIRSWMAEADEGKWRTHTGVYGGSIVVSEWTTCTPKSQVTAEAQAQFEAKAAMQNKLDRAYHATLEAAQSGKPAMFQPMLAKEFGKESKKAGPIIEKGMALVQPKLDGIRCIISAEGAFSRQNQEFHSIPHIIEALKPFFAAYPDAILDGELYNHRLKDDFQEITSIVRREKLSLPDLAKSRELIQYHIYDSAGEGDNCLERTFDVREFFCLSDSYPDQPFCIQFVPTVVFDPSLGLGAYHTVNVHAGYEGTMVRLPGPYENKRSSLLLKFKDFDTAEFEIVRLEEGNGNWAGCVKRVVFKTLAGTEFGAGIRGTQAEMAKLLKNQAQWIGAQATVRYFGLTDDGIPRFPVVIDMHKAGRVD